jgi:hypothetical protein
VTPRDYLKSFDEKARQKYQSSVNNVTLILMSCQEFQNDRGTITVPWDQVEDATLLSDSMLVLKVRLHRYFRDKKVRKVVVELLIGPCPANRYTQSSTMS